MLMNTSIKVLTNSEHIPPPILHVKAFQIFPFLLSLLPFPPSIAFTQKQNQKARHSCRAQNSQKQTRAQLSCLLLSQLSFSLSNFSEALRQFSSLLPLPSLNIEKLKRAPERGWEKKKRQKIINFRLI